MPDNPLFESFDAARQEPQWSVTTIRLVIMGNLPRVPNEKFAQQLNVRIAVPCRHQRIAESYHAGPKSKCNGDNWHLRSVRYVIETVFHDGT